MFRLFLIVCIASILLVGCEQGRSPNIVDMMTDVTTTTEPIEGVSDEPGEGVSDEPELPTIGFDVEIEKPAILESVEILPDDNVYPTKTLTRAGVKLNDDGEPDVNGKLHGYDPFIFDDALSALTDEGVLTFFEWVEEKVEDYCNTRFETDGDVEIGEDYDPGGASTEQMHVHFTQRSEADKFVKQIEGPWKDRMRRYVSIFNNEKVYFVVVVNSYVHDDDCE